MTDLLDVNVWLALADARELHFPGSLGATREAGPIASRGTPAFIGKSDPNHHERLFHENHLRRYYCRVGFPLLPLCFLPSPSRLPTAPPT